MVTICGSSPSLDTHGNCIQRNKKIDTITLTSILLPFNRENYYQRVFLFEKRSEKWKFHSQFRHHSKRFARKNPSKNNLNVWISQNIKKKCNYFLKYRIIWKLIETYLVWDVERAFQTGCSFNSGVDTI